MAVARVIRDALRPTMFTRHRPTRCPTCKGALIERTSSAAHIGFIWFHCLFCNNWWKFRTDESYVIPDGEVTGEVFIVTKGGITYILDSVAVNAIPADDAQKHLENKARQRESENQRLHQDIESLTAALEIARADEDRLWKILQQEEGNSQKARAWRVAYRKTENIAKKIEVLNAERQNVSSGADLFEGLPSAVSSAKTDANGKFTLVIPRQGAFVVVACGPRETFRDIEPCWFVRVSLDGEASKRLILSNDNVLEARLEKT